MEEINSPAQLVALWFTGNVCVWGGGRGGGGGKEVGAMLL